MPRSLTHADYDRLVRLQASVSRQSAFAALGRRTRAVGNGLMHTRFGLVTLVRIGGRR